MSVPIRVLVVDDSAFMRHAVSKLLTADPSLVVVGTAKDGVEALEKLNRQEVDVVTLDLEMPRMDGLTTLQQMLYRRPVPVVMVSSWTRQGADATIRALALGAIDFVCKPSGAGSLKMESVAEELRAKVKRAAAAGVRGRGSGQGRGAETNRPEQREWTDFRSPTAAESSEFRPRVPIRIVAIGSSTGGPKALHEVLSRVGRDFPVPIVVVQHMPPGFTRSLAEHLDEVCPLEVREARAGDTLSAGRVFVAPGDHHLVVRRHGMIELNQEPPLHGVRPAFDVTLASLEQAYGSSCLVVLLTGMGSDGAEGALRIRKSGGHVIAEHESTCVVYGMPRTAIENGAADRVVPLPQIASTIEQLVCRGRIVDSGPRTSTIVSSLTGRG